MEEELLVDESALLRRIAEGEEAAFGLLFDRFWKKVYTIALTYIKSSQAAEDVTQDVFLKFWKARERLTEVENLDNYLFIMTRNEVLKALRKKTPQYNLPPFSETGQEDPDGLPDQKVSYKELQHQLHQAIGLLPPQQQQALRLSREEGLSHEEIAEVMNLSKNTVKNYIVKGLNFVRLYLQEHGRPMALLVFWIYCENSWC